MEVLRNARALVLRSNVDTFSDRELVLVSAFVDSLDSIREIPDNVSTSLWRRGLDLVDLTVSHSDNSVGECLQTHIVRHHDHSDLFFHVQIHKNLHHDVSAARVQISCWLVKQ